MDHPPRQGSAHSTVSLEPGLTNPGPALRWLQRTTHSSLLPESPSGRHAGVPWPASTGVCIAREPTTNPYHAPSSGVNTSAGAAQPHAFGAARLRALRRPRPGRNRPWDRPDPGPAKLSLRPFYYKAPSQWRHAPDAAVPRTRDRLRLGNATARCGTAKQVNAM